MFHSMHSFTYSSRLNFLPTWNKKKALNICLNSLLYQVYYHEDIILQKFIVKENGFDKNNDVPVS